MFQWMVNKYYEGKEEDKNGTGNNRIPTVK